MTSSILVGLTGGIGAGKSTVARMLAEHGAHIVDGDAASRWVVDPKEGNQDLLTRIAELLGAGALHQDGTLNRAFVAERIFSDDPLRHSYNALLRPAILAEVARRIEQARLTPGIIVHEIPLLSRLTAALPWEYDVVVSVEAGRAVQLQRLLTLRGHSIDDARRRLRAQGNEADRAAIADIVLRADKTIDELHDAVSELWARLSAWRPPQ